MHPLTEKTGQSPQVRSQPKPGQSLLCDTHLDAPPEIAVPMDPDDHESSTAQSREAMAAAALRFVDALLGELIAVANPPKQGFRGDPVAYKKNRIRLSKVLRHLDIEEPSRSQPSKRASRPPKPDIVGAGRGRRAGPTSTTPPKWSENS